MSQIKYYRCNHCGNIVAMVEDKGVPLFCCGEKMELLEPNTTDAAVEKHVPVVEVEQDHVVIHVGSVEHPMTEEHYIEWIALATGNTVMVEKLHPGDAPGACFKADISEGATVYAYCNLHGLWATEL